MENKPTIQTKELAEAITKGFEIVKTPDVVRKEDQEQFFKQKGHAPLELFPTISRAFPIVLVDYGKISSPGQFDLYVSDKTRVNVQGRFPMNSQQINTLNVIYGIETSGKLIEKLKKWNGENILLPADTKDNGFIHFFMRDFDLSELEKRMQKTPIPQLKEIPRDLIQGPFYQKYGEDFYKQIQTLKGIFGNARKSGTDFDDYIIGNEGEFMKYFTAVRNLHENGARNLNALEEICLDKFPTWRPTDGTDLKTGDYVQGTFIKEDYFRDVEGIIVDKRIDNDGRTILDLNYVGSGRGDEEGNIDNLKLGKNYKSKAWKFVSGEK